MSKDELFLGMSIGDGHIDKKRGSLYISHSEKYIDYLLFKYGLLMDNGIKCGKVRKKKDISGYSTNSSFCFETSGTFYGKEMRRYLYPNGIKIIPDDLIITPMMWSFIYMDDGRQNKISHYNSVVNGEKVRVDVSPWVNRYTIYADCFDERSVKNLISSLSYYGVDSGISYSNKNLYPHIHISKKDSKENFRNLILPYIPKSMMYKINLQTFITQK